MPGPQWMRRRHNPEAHPERSEEERAKRRERQRRYYEELRLEPVEDDLAVFAAYWFSAFSCNPRAIHDKLGELLPHVRRVWVIQRDLMDAAPPGFECVAARSREYYDVIARAKFFVNNVNFPNHMVKRDGTVHIQTHHGTPLKKMGLDNIVQQPDQPEDAVETMLKRTSRWDYSLSSNPYSTEIWTRVYPGHYESLEYGYPRNDVLANASADDVRAARRSLGIADDARSVLYAPTHREYVQGFTPTFDVARMAENLGSGTVLMTRPHYAYDEDPRLGDLHRAGRILDVAAHPTIEQLYLAADVLVTDYSSTMFDFAVLDRPIIIHAPDWEEYQQRRGTYFDLLAEPPGVVTRTDAELLDALTTGADDASARAAFRARFCPYDDGKAAERVVRRVWSM
jgi:CDP-glycerol glycerophosphotransferase (TagB/SpsB family)